MDHNEEPVSTDFALRTERRQLAERITRMEAMLAGEPEDWHWMARLSLAEDLMRSGRWSDADRHCGQVLESHPEHRKALRLGAEIVDGLGDSDRANDLRRRLEEVVAALRVSLTLEAFVDENGSGSLLVRTDFSNEPEWAALSATFISIVPQLIVVDDRRFGGLGAAELAALAGSLPFFVFAADSMSPGPEPTLLVVDRDREPGRSFRVGPDHVNSVETNLAASNMDFRDFADSTDENNVFKGFA